MAAASLGTARQALRAPQPSDTEDRDGEVPICQPPCPAPRRARLTLAFFSLLCRVASGTRSSSSLLHPNSGSVSALAPKTPVPWRQGAVACPPHCMRSPNFLGIPLCHGGPCPIPQAPAPELRSPVFSPESCPGQQTPGKTGRPRKNRLPSGGQDAPGKIE